MIAKYKKTKCIANIFGRDRKRKTTKYIDEAIQRKVKVDRQNQHHLYDRKLHRSLA